MAFPTTSSIRQFNLRFRAKWLIRRGGVYKKRLNKNRDRAIILTKSAGYWFYTFLYAKQDMANINHRELMGFRELAKHYANLSEEKTTALVKSKELVEICDDSKK